MYAVVSTKRCEQQGRPSSGQDHVAHGEISMEFATVDTESKACRVMSSQAS
jgi:hypothetical protein